MHSSEVAEQFGFNKKFTKLSYMCDSPASLLALFLETARISIALLVLVLPFWRRVSALELGFITPRDFFFC